MGQANPTPHALAPARHSAQPFMPIGLGVVAWPRCGARARTYAQRMDRRMRRTKIRQGDALEVPSERRFTIRTTTALTNTIL